MPDLHKLATLLVVFGVGCGDSTPPPEPRTIQASNEAIIAAVGSNEAVALKLESSLAAEPGNLVYSPLSIEAITGLLYAGALGNTASQLAALIDPPADASLFHQGLGALLADLGGNYPGRGYTLAIANRLFVQHDRQPSAAYLATASDLYHAPVQLEDFGDPEQVRADIDAWVSEQTAEHIPELFHAGDITAQDLLALVDAIYFKADWKTAFDKAKTAQGMFHRGDGTTVSVPMMASKVSGRSGSIAGAIAVELPYLSGDLAFLALLPDAKLGVAALEAALADSDLSTLVAQGLGSEGEVSLVLPRFSMRAHLDLRPIMQRLGVTDLFDATKANLSGIAPDSGLYVNSFVHEAWIQVDETGTEAAAATGAGVAMRSATFPISFDRPFLFFIRDTLSGAIVFAGRVTDPSVMAP